MKKLAIGLVLFGLIIGVYLVTRQADSADVTLLKDTLTSLYTINNQNEYDEYIEQLSDPTIKDQVPLVYTEYEEFCTEKGLGSIFGNRLYTDYRKAAKNDQFTMQVKEIEIEKTFEIKADGSVLNEYTTVGYTYNIQLEINYETEQNKQIMNEEGSINLKEIKGEWKIDLLSPKNKKFLINQ